MATVLQQDTTCPICTTSDHNGVRNHEATTARSLASPEKLVRRSKDGPKSSRGCCSKSHKNSKRRCVPAYLRIIWVDLTMLLLFGALILGLYYAPVNHHDMALMPFWTQFPVLGNFTEPHWDIRAPVEYLYPYRNSPLSDLACALIVTLVPIAIIGLFQLKIRSLWDFNAGQFGILKAVTTTTLIMLLMKLYISAFRPNFFDVCQPDRTMLQEEIVRHYTNHTAMFFNASACTGEKERIKIALQSFPSGHVANSFAVAIFLTLYINAKLKTIGDHASQYWVFILTIAPLILSSMLAALMVITHQHHMRDIYAGMMLGLIVGTVCYRSKYAALFDSRFNHIPLPPFASKTRFLYIKEAEKFRADICDGNGDREIDKLVVWNWWKLESNEQSMVKQNYWLRNIRSARAMGCGNASESGPILPQTQGDIISFQRSPASAPVEATKSPQSINRVVDSRHVKRTPPLDIQPMASGSNLALGSGTVEARAIDVCEL